MIARQVGANAHPRREAATRCEWMAPLLARYLVPYLVPSDGAPAHDRRWLYSKICARCVGRGVVCWRLMAAIAMGRFRFTRRGGGFPRRATDSGASAAAGRRRARGCARTVRAPARLPAVSYHCGTNNLLAPLIVSRLLRGGGLSFGTGLNRVLTQHKGYGTLALDLERCVAGCRCALSVRARSALLTSDGP